MAVGSVSTPESNYVVDLLYESRELAIKSFRQILEDPLIAKISCGCSNDLTRLRKDWGIFPIGIIDVQELFGVFKMDSPEACFRTCLPTITNKLKEPKNKHLSQKELFQRLTQQPGIEFLISVFFEDLPPMENPKDKKATVADWSIRPLDSFLQAYAAGDSHYALKLFYVLADLVS